MTTIDLDAAGRRITDVVEGLLADHPTVPAVSVSVLADDGRLLSIARGVADPATGEAITPAHAFRIASCTKTFVAATIVDLVTDGSLGLDEPVIDHLPGDIADLLAKYEHGRTITVREVLQHRSGLVDHSTFPEFGAALASRWTPQQQLAIAVAKPALFAPGTAMSYSDSGYVVLGQVVEHLTGQPLAAAVRARAGIDATTMPSLHWEIAEATPAGLVRAHQLFEGDDSHDWPPYFDLFGGGGLVSTLDDLCRWWSAWFTGRVGHVDLHLADPRPTFTAEGVEFPGGTRVGLGVFGRDIAGHAVWNHGGFWGLETGHVPALQASYALSITHRAPGLPSPLTLGAEVVSALVAARS